MIPLGAAIIRDALVEDGMPKTAATLLAHRIWARMEAEGFRRNVKED